MDILLYNENSKVTAKLLSTELSLVPKTRLERGDNVIVRYGTSIQRQQNETNFNNPGSITIVGNSYTFSKFCKENEIRSVEYIPVDQFNTLDETFFPLLLRKKYHFGGRDIKVVSNLQELSTQNLDSFQYGVPVIQTTSEFRVHVLGMNVLKIFSKSEGQLVDGVPIRSSNFGWLYKRCGSDSFPIAKKVCIEAVEKVGLQFAAVDIGYNSETKHYTIFEINSAPGLSSNQNTFNMYVQFLRGVL